MPRRRLPLLRPPTILNLFFILVFRSRATQASSNAFWSEIGTFGGEGDDGGHRASPSEFDGHEHQGMDTSSSAADGLASSLAHPSASDFLRFSAGIDADPAFGPFGSAGNSYDTGGEDTGRTAETEPTSRFPTLIPPIGGIHQQRQMVRVTGQSGLVWARGDQQGVGSGDGEAERMGMPVGEVRDVSMMRSVPVFGLGLSGVDGVAENAGGGRRQFGGWLDRGGPMGGRCFGGECAAPRGVGPGSTTPFLGDIGGGVPAGDGTYEFPTGEEAGGFRSDGRSSPNQAQQGNTFGGGSVEGSWIGGDGAGAFGGIDGVPVGGADESPEEAEDELGAEIAGLGPHSPWSSPMDSFAGGEEATGVDGGPQKYAEYLEAINHRYGVRVPEVQQQQWTMAATNGGGGGGIRPSDKRVQPVSAGGNHGRVLTAPVSRPSCSFARLQNSEVNWDFLGRRCPLIGNDGRMEGPPGPRGATRPWAEPTNAEQVPAQQQQQRVPSNIAALGSSTSLSTLIPLRAEKAEDPFGEGTGGKELRQWQNFGGQAMGSGGGGGEGPNQQRTSPGANSNGAEDHHQLGGQQQLAQAALEQSLLLALLHTPAPSPLPPETPAVSPFPPPITPPPTITTKPSAPSSTAHPTATLVVGTEEERSKPMGQSNTISVRALSQQIRRLPAVLYSDSRKSESRRLEVLLRDAYGLPLVTFYADKIDDHPGRVESNLEQLTAHHGMPYLFICGTFIGSLEHIQNYHQQKQIPRLVEYVCSGEAEKEQKRKEGREAEKVQEGRATNRKKKKRGTTRKSRREERRKAEGKEEEKYPKPKKRFVEELIN